MEGYKAKTVVIEHHCDEIDKTRSEDPTTKLTVEFRDTEWKLGLDDRCEFYLDTQITYCPFCGRDLRQDA